MEGNPSDMSLPVSVESLQSWLIQRVANLCHVPAEDVDPSCRFKDLGLESAAALTLTAELGVMLERAIRPTLVWDHPTIELVVDFLTRPGAPDGPADALASPQEAQGEPIAIVGMSCRFPGAPDLRSFWELLARGGDAVGEVPAQRWDAHAIFDPDLKAPGKACTRWGGFLEQVDAFDAAFFGITPREAEQMDPQQRLMMELSWEALEDAGIPPTSLKGSPFGVFFGAMWNDYDKLGNHGLASIGPHTATGRDLSIIAARVSYTLGLRGPSMVLGTACSSSLVAVHQACQSLRAGESGAALAGGVNLTITPHGSVMMSKFGGMATDGRSKAFDARADGYVRAEGGGVVVLKPLRAALRAGDPLYCLIRGGAVNNDGFSNGLTAPSPDAQEAMLRSAYAASQVEPGAVHFVEAHGTGTFLGDPIEAGALGTVMSNGRDPAQPLLLGAVKTNLGHLEAAAGVAGLIKTALAIDRRQIPPNLNFQSPNPNIPMEQYLLEVPTAAIPWPGDGPPLAGVSAFGFGGTNCHLVLEGIPQPSPPDFPAGAASAVFVYCGSGPQWPGMGRELLLSDPAFRAAVIRCDEALAELWDRSVLDFLMQGTCEEAVLDPLQAPLALFALQVGLTEAWKRRGVQPSAVVGHSVGEVSAAYAAGAISLEDAARVVFHRSRLQATTSGRGAMCVVSMAGPELTERLREIPGVGVAAMNGPCTTVISGDAEAVAQASSSLEAEGVEVRRVPIDIAGHSRHMSGLDNTLTEILSPFKARPGLFPYISTVTGDGTPGRELDARYWGRNLRQPVRFTAAIQGLLSRGARDFLELGPHPVLSRGIQELGDQAGLEVGVAHSLNRDDPAQQTMNHAHAGLPREAAPAPTRTFIPVSARDKGALRARCSQVEQAVAAAPSPAAVARIAHTAALRRDHMGHRAVVTVGDSGDPLANSPFLVSRRPCARPRVALVFSGQGSQWPAMGAELLRCCPIFREALADCSAALEPHLGWCLFSFIRDNLLGDRLDRISHVQPAIFALQVALAALWRSVGVEPVAVVGHSLGEVAAAHVAGALSLEDAATVICGRSHVLQRAAGKGAMVAVPLSLADAAKIEAAQAGAVSVAVVNGGPYCVLSGEPAPLKAVADGLSEQGLEPRWVAVDVAAHSAQMVPLQADLQAAVEHLEPRALKIPMVSSVTGEPVEGASLDAAYWARNLRDPVRFDLAAARLLAAGFGVDAFIEVSPHPLLLDAVEWLARERGLGRVITVGSLGRDLPDQETMMDNVTRLWAAGQDISFDALFTGGRGRALLPPYPWQRKRFWPSPATLAAQPARGPSNGARQPLGSKYLHTHLESSADPHLHFFESWLDIASEPSLEAHCLDSEPVVSAGVLLDMALAGAKRASKGGLSLADVRFESPITLDPSVGGQKVQLVVDRGGWRMSRREQGAWRTAARGELTVGAMCPAPVPQWEALKTAEPTTAEAHYEALKERGIIYQKELRSISALYRRGEHGLAEVLPNRDRAGLLDACLQTLLATLETPGLFVVARIASVELLGPCSETRWVWATRSPGRSTGDVMLLAVDGTPLALLHGVRLAQMSRNLWVERWRPDLAGVSPGRLQAPVDLSGPWLVAGGSEDLAQALCEAGGRGWRRIRDLQGCCEEAEGANVVLLYCTPPDLEQGSLLGQLTAACTDLITAGRARRLVLVTCRAIQVQGEDEATTLGPAALHGMMRVFQAEHPEATARIIDIEDPHDPLILDQLMPEIVRPRSSSPAASDRGGDLVWGDRLALRRGRRYLPQRLSWREEPRAGLGWDGALLLTGGLGAVGLSVTRWMVEQGARDLVLVGRQPPSEAAAAIIKKTRRQGAAVEVVQADVEDYQAMARILSDIEAGGRRLAGIIHMAGVLDDALLEQTDQRRLRGALGPKVAGAWNLHRLTQDRALDLFVLFSSIGGWMGLAGQGAYAAANAFLDGLAQHRRAMGLPGVSIGWCGWQDLGFAATRGGRSVLAHLEEQGVSALTATEALSTLGQVLSSNAPPRVAVMPPSAALSPRAGDSAAPPPLWRQEILEASPVQRQLSILTHHVRQALGEVTRIPPESIDPACAMRDLGLDSMMAAELVDQLNGCLGLEIPKMALWQHPTLEALCRHLARKLGLKSDGGHRGMANHPELEQASLDLYMAVEGLTEQEILQLLEEEKLRG